MKILHYNRLQTNKLNINSFSMQTFIKWWQFVRPPPRIKPHALPGAVGCKFFFLEKILIVIKNISKYLMMFDKVRNIINFYDTCLCSRAVTSLFFTNKIFNIQFNIHSVPIEMSLYERECILINDDCKEYRKWNLPPPPLPLPINTFKWK